MGTAVLFVVGSVGGSAFTGKDLVGEKLRLCPLVILNIRFCQQTTSNSAGYNELR